MPVNSATSQKMYEISHPVDVMITRVSLGRRKPVPCLFVFADYEFRFWFSLELLSRDSVTLSLGEEIKANQSINHLRAWVCCDLWKNFMAFDRPPWVGVSRWFRCPKELKSCARRSTHQRTWDDNKRRRLRSQTSRLSAFSKNKFAGEWKSCSCSIKRAIALNLSCLH